VSFGGFFREKSNLKSHAIVMANIANLSDFDRFSQIPCIPKGAG